MYQAVTRGISVTVTPRYMPEESSPDAGSVLLCLHGRDHQRGAWSASSCGRATGASPTSTVTCRRCAARASSARSRCSARAKASAIPAAAPSRPRSGTMQGTYLMETAGGETFDAEIPPSPSTFPARNAWCTEVFMSLNGQRFTPLEMLAKLVSFDTVSSKSNLPLIDFRRELSAELERALYARAERGRRQGGALCHDRPAGSRRDRALGPHRRGAGHGPGLDVRSLHASRRERARLWTRRGGHEGVRCAGARPGSGVPGGRSRHADPHHALLRRGDDVPWRRRYDPPPRPRPAPAGSRDRRRADELEVVDAHKSVVTFTTTCTASRRIPRNPISARAP